MADVEEILLQSKDSFNDLLRWDRSSGEWVRTDRAHLSLKPHEFPFVGVFVEVGGDLLKFYRREGDLFFAAKADEVKIGSSDHAVLKVLEDSECVFKITRGEEILLEYHYNRGDLEGEIEGDSTGHIEDEDFDFCLFALNVLNDPERRGSIWT